MLSNHLSINLPKASINVTWGIFFWKEMILVSIQPLFAISLSPSICWGSGES